MLAFLFWGGGQVSEDEMGLESRKKPDPARTANGCAFTKTDVSVVTRHLHRLVAKERLARALVSSVRS